MKYILNSAVLTAFGQWEYQPLAQGHATALLEVRDIAPALPGEDFFSTALRPTVAAWKSTIGYQETATALEQLCGLAPGSIPVNRVQIVMEPGDEAIVFRLVLPPGSPRIAPGDKGAIAEHIDAGHWELGMLRRLA